MPDYPNEEDYPELDLEDFEVEVPTPEEVFQTIDWSVADDPDSWGANQNV